MKTIFIFFAFSFACCFVKADDTNVVFITDDGYLMQLNSGGKLVVSPDVAEAAKKMKECLPATDFPEGNWGLVKGGFQLSLRFEKQIFTNGEPITGILLMRNVTNENVYLQYNPFPIGYADGPIGFQVTPDSGQPLIQHEYNAEIWNGGGFRWLKPGTQAKYFERLDKRFNFKNGTYTVVALKTASCLPWPKIENGTPVFMQSLQTNVQLQSAPVTIKIEDSPPK